ncbi:MAG TPA: ChbG/HpnK family deacetylase [Candidatus Binatia bacterium]|nr:ChbG/HpnK family deacetylase [Candidatus Binatia bacterium]
MRRLIVNADDLGLTPGVNRGIAEAHERGIVTSTTLMANALAFDDAARVAFAARDEKPLSVGCHVVLLDGEPLLPSGRVPTLLQPGRQNGRARFRESLNNFVVASFRHKLDAGEIEEEAAAQMERIRAAGIQPSHFDTHKHAHMFPAVLRPLLRAARANNVPAVRNPFGQVWPLPLASLLRTRQLWKRFAQLNIMRNFAVSFRREVQAHGLRTTDGSLGVLVTGVLDLKLFSAIIDSIPEGTWEFVCHPGYNDAELGNVRTRLRQSREQELRLLTSPEAKDLLEQRGIDLISYHDL